MCHSLHVVWFVKFHQLYLCIFYKIATIPYDMYGFTFSPTGQVTIPGEITFQLNAGPATDPPVFTLTCTSTGGPATTVSWRRDGTMLSDDSTYTITSQVTDSETATYTHTLTVTGRLVGEYQCSVSNIRTPSGSSRSLTVVGKVPEIWHGLYICVEKERLIIIFCLYSTGVPDPPTDLSATQVGPTSIRVSWTAPVSGAPVTRYRISYSGGTDRGIVDVGATVTDHIITITPPLSRLTYSISIITLSSSFPSSLAGPVMVTVGKCNTLSILHICLNPVRHSLSPTTTIPVTPETTTESMNSECVYCVV